MVVTPPFSDESIQPSWPWRGVQSPATGCTCESMRPGDSVVPRQSMTVLAPSTSQSAYLPTAAMRPSSTMMVSASRMGLSRSPDNSRPIFLMTTFPDFSTAAAVAMFTLLYVSMRNAARGGPESGRAGRLDGGLPARSCGGPYGVDGPVRSAQSVFALDLAHLQAADARQRAARVGDGHGDHDLVGARRIRNTGFDRVEMATDESGVLMAQRHVDGRADAAHLLGRRHQGCAFFDRLAQRRAELGMQDGGGMLELARLADD